MGPNTDWIRLCGSNAFKSGVPRSEVAAPPDLRGYWLDGWDAAARGEKVICAPIEWVASGMRENVVILDYDGHGIYCWNRSATH